MTEKQRMHPDGSRLHQFGNITWSTHGILAGACFLLFEIALALPGLGRANATLLCIMAFCAVVSSALFLKAMLIAQDPAVWTPITQETDKKTRTRIRLRIFYAWSAFVVGSVVLSLPELLKPVMFGFISVN